MIKDNKTQTRGDFCLKGVPMFQSRKEPENWEIKYTTIFLRGDKLIPTWNVFNYYQIHFL